MIAYSYNENTKEFISEIECQLDQLETIKQGKDIFLVPKNATVIPIA